MHELARDGRLSRVLFGRDVGRGGPRPGYLWLGLCRCSVASPIQLSVSRAPAPLGDGGDARVEYLSAGEACPAYAMTEVAKQRLCVRTLPRYGSMPASMHLLASPAMSGTSALGNLPPLHRHSRKNKMPGRNLMCCFWRLEDSASRVLYDTKRYEVAAAESVCLGRVTLADAFRSHPHLARTAWPAFIRSTSPRDGKIS